MSLEEYGKFVLETDSNAYELKIGANLIAIKNDSLFHDKNIENPECEFVINIDRESAYVMSIKGPINSNNKSSSILQLNDGKSFSVNNRIFVFKYVYEIDKAEDIINDFMNGVLSFPVDMEKVFFDYAKRIKITEHKAISSVMASIDIPEIDEI